MLDTLFDESLFDELYKEAMKQPTKRSLRTNFYNLADREVLKIEVAGFKKEEISIERVNDRAIKVSVEKEEHEEIKGKREFVMESCSRIYTTRRDIDFDNVKASVENGILIIEMPYIKENTNFRKITID